MSHGALSTYYLIMWKVANNTGRIKRPIGMYCGKSRDVGATRIIGPGSSVRAIGAASLISRRAAGPIVIEYMRLRRDIRQIALDWCDGSELDLMASALWHSIRRKRPTQELPVAGAAENLALVEYQPTAKNGL